MSTASNHRPRVVVTGMGWVTPLGHDLPSVWSKLVGSDSGVTPIDRFDAATFPTPYAAQVRDYDFTRYVKDPQMHERAGLHSHFALGNTRFLIDNHSRYFA